MIEANWTRSTEPTDLPVSVDEIKMQARIAHNDEDALVESYVRAATAAAEEYMGRGILTQTWTLWLDDWADEIPLPMAAPLQSVSSVKYYDTSGTLATLSSAYYTVDSVERPAVIYKAPTYTWPSLQSDRGGGRVQVIYVVGWSSDRSVPERIKQGIRVYAAALDEARAGIEIDLKMVERVCQSLWSDRVFTPPVPC